MSETCPKCGGVEFSIRADTAERMCGKCWHFWLPITRLEELKEASTPNPLARLEELKEVGTPDPLAHLQKLKEEGKLQELIQPLNQPLRIIEGNTGTLREYYGLLDRVETDLIQGQKLCTVYAPDVTDCATDLLEAFTKLKTAVVEAAIMEGEIQWP